jgi:hypothetical protein
MNTCTPASAAGRRYRRRFLPVMAVYVVVVMGVSWAFNVLEPTGPLAWALAVSPAVPLLAAIVVIGLYLKEESDEFVRNVLVESMIWGIGVTLGILTVWGFLEIYAHAPRLPSFMAFPIFCGAMGIAQPFVSRRYR